MISFLTALFLLAPHARATTLVAERFDVGELPAGWKAGVGAQTGGGPASTYTFEGGALVMRAEPRTKRFTALFRKSELRDVTWIRVQARTRMSGVAAGASGASCGVFVRFEGGPIEASRP